MPLSYSTSTTDGPQKTMLCGRVAEINELISNLALGHSIALFGERRIGKTLLLYVLRDVINGKAEIYKTRMLDRELSNSVDGMHAQLPQHRAVYIDLLSIDKSNPESLLKSLYREVIKIGVRLPQSTLNASISDFFAILNSKLAPSEYIVFLLDEVEVLFDFDDSQQIFKNLRSVIQARPQFHFVFSGAENWHSQIKSKTSPLVNNVRPFYLKAAAARSIGDYLISLPLQSQLSSVCDIHDITKTIIVRTGGKPYYVQAMCQVVLEIRTSTMDLPENWPDLVETKTEDFVSMAALKPFYTGEHLDDLSKKILALLANEPNLSIEQVSKRLGLSRKSISEKMSDLENFDKIREESPGYRITGAFIENWGRKTQDTPVVRKPFRIKLNWLIALISLVLAILCFLSANPSVKVKSFSYAAGAIVVRMPSSLETEEEGIAALTVHNISSATIYSLTISFPPSNISYEHDGSNRIVFSSIAAGEAKSDQMKFIALEPISGTFMSRIIASQDGTGVLLDDSYSIEARLFSIKKYWGVLSAFFLAISGLSAKPDLLSFLASLISSVVSAGKKQG